MYWASTWIECLLIQQACASERHRRRLAAERRAQRPIFHDIGTLACTSSVQKVVLKHVLHTFSDVRQGSYATENDKTGAYSF